MHQNKLELKELPKLPIPPLTSTLKKYETAVRPLVSPEMFEKTKKYLNHFTNTDGPMLQKELKQLAKDTPTSWLEGFWDTMYLEFRDPLPININPFFLFQPDSDKNDQVSRSIKIVLNTINWIKKMMNNDIKYDKEGDIPLCMCQYNNIFASCRIPNTSRDKLEKFEDSNHITILSNNKFYSLTVTNGENVISQKQLKNNLQQILEDSFENQEPSIGVLTTSNRNTWAQNYSKLIEDPQNCESLKEIQSSLFILNLDQNNPQSISEASRVLLHSDGKNRYFDKPLQFIVCQNGYAGLNFEHSGVDGHTLLRLVTDIYQMQLEHENENTMDYNFSNFEKLQWNLSQEIKKQINIAEEKFLDFTNSVDSKVLEFSQFGKKLIVKNRFSPDAFIQMAFHLTHFRLKNEFVSTYESTQTKRFYHGRTETLRSSSPAAKKFVESFDDPRIKPTDRLIILQKAVEQHVQLMKMCKSGFGVNRHLYGLCNLAKQRNQKIAGYKIPELFLDPSYSIFTTDVMSTSSCGGPALNLFGFGPTCPYGFGLGYMIKNDTIHINITSFQGEASNFAKVLSQTLVDMGNFVEKSWIPEPKL